MTAYTRNPFTGTMQALGIRLIQKTTDPSATDDGYPVGTNWLNTSTTTLFALVDSTTNAAVWQEIGNTITAVPASDLIASGAKVTLTANENQAFGDVCRIDSDGEAHIADASVIATASALVMCADATISADTAGTYLLQGVARQDAWGWTVGGLIYLTITGTTTNTLTQTAPGSGTTRQVLGVATHADRMYFSPSLSQAELA